MGEELFVKLRDCFTAGYTLPQYCIDNGIKKPLFVSEKKYELFLWEIYVQFHYDKRMVAQFSFIDGDQILDVNHGFSFWVIPRLRITPFSKVNLDYFDAIILLTKENVSAMTKKVICLAELERTFLDQAHSEIPLLHFMQRHPGVKLFTTILPDNIRRYKDSAEHLKTLPFITYFQGELQKNINADIVTPLDKFGYIHQEVLEMISLHSKIITASDGITILGENDHPLIRIKNGKRMTAYQPERYKNRIYFVGTCHFVGAFAPFDKTIESYLQKMLNEHNLPYCVENEGQYYNNRYQDIFYNLNKLTPKPGDIIFIMQGTTKNVPSIDLRDAFDPPRDYREFFIDVMHFNELGYKLMAERYFKFLSENNFFRDVELKYPLPPPIIIDTAYLLGSKVAA